jgi:hypothetical protein
VGWHARAVKLVCAYLECILENLCQHKLHVWYHQEGCGAVAALELHIRCRTVLLNAERPAAQHSKATQHRSQNIWQKHKEQEVDLGPEVNPQAVPGRQWEAMFESHVRVQILMNPHYCRRLPYSNVPTSGKDWRGTLTFTPLVNPLSTCR